MAQEEIFGPVLAVSTYDGEEEAIAMANNSIYGLNGAIFSKDVEKALSLAGRIKTGTVEINGGGVGFHAPIGGVKASGLGREGGPEGFDPLRRDQVRWPPQGLRRHASSSLNQASSKASFLRRQPASVR